MSILNKIAYFQGRRDDIPNQELARELVANRDVKGISEIAENLWNRDNNIQSDCLKVLYETGYLEPSLVAGYVDDFMKMLRSPNNRLVWGSMITLSTIASLQADALYSHIEEIKQAMENGSVITVDNGIKVLSAIAASSESRRCEIMPYLIAHLSSCRPKDVPQHAEAITAAVNLEYKAEFIRVLQTRMQDMSAPQTKRVTRVIRDAGK